jgi:hypothetical protein
LKTYLDCYPCILRQALDAARFTGVNESQQEKILHKVMDLLKHMTLGTRPPEISEQIHSMIRRELNNDDPYKELKLQSTQEALNLLPWLRNIIRESPNPFETAIRLSIAGNIIDFGAANKFDLRKSIQQVLQQSFAIADIQSLQQLLTSSPWVLYLADNAGETVFDKLLIENLGKPAFYVVRSGPIINDAIRQDAIQAGLDQVATIIESGTRIPGGDPDQGSPEFKKLFNEAELIISKGQGNYEMLSEFGPRLFFLLQVKCAVIARDLGVPQGSIVVKQGDL